MRLLLLAASISMSAAFFVAQRVEACSCGVHYPGMAWPSGSTPVPRTTDIWFWANDEWGREFIVNVDEFSLVGPSGPVATRRQVITAPRSGSKMLRLEPLEELETGLHTVMRAGEEYETFVVEDFRDVHHRPEFLARHAVFRAGDDPRELCGGASLARFEVRASEPSTLWLIKLESDEVDVESDQLEISGLAYAALADESLSIGAASCPTTVEAQPGEQLRLSFGSFDMSGNFSGWTDAVDVRVPTAEDPSGPTELPVLESDGCAAVRPSGLLPFWLLFLVLFTRRCASRSPML